MNIAEGALNPGVAPGTHLRVEAELVHGARVGFEEWRQAQRRFGERAGILEAFRSVETDPAAAEEVIEQESALPHAAAIFILAEPDVLEAGEQARLQVIPTVDQTDVELAFLTAGIAHVLGFRLHTVRAVAAKWREELASALDSDVARRPVAHRRTNVEAQQRELLVAGLRLVQSVRARLFSDNSSLVLR